MVHTEHPCRTAEEHIAVSVIRNEADPPADFLDRFAHERDEEERLVAIEDARALANGVPMSELELRYRYGDR